MTRSDLDTLLGFVAEAGELDVDEPYSTKFLELTETLIPSTWITYQEVDHGHPGSPVLVGIGPEAPVADFDAYLATGPCPTQAYRAETGDLSAIRNSDLVSPRVFRESAIYNEYFHPAEVEHIAEVGLPASPGHSRSLLFFREPGTRNFSERDREMMERLRPHLKHFEDLARLRGELIRALAPSDAEDGGLSVSDGGWVDMSAQLTNRELEIVELVASGMTNAEVAAVLWIAPSTVKKHLENVYAKTGVGRRTVIAALKYSSDTG